MKVYTTCTTYWRSLDRPTTRTHMQHKPRQVSLTIENLPWPLQLIVLAARSLR